MQYIPAEVSPLPGGYGSVRVSVSVIQVWGVTKQFRPNAVGPLTRFTAREKRRPYQKHRDAITQARRHQHPYPLYQTVIPLSHTAGRISSTSMPSSTLFHVLIHSVQLAITISVPNTPHSVI